MGFPLNHSLQRARVKPVTRFARPLLWRAAQLKVRYAALGPKGGYSASMRKGLLAVEFGDNRPEEDRDGSYARERKDLLP